ncbi:delta and Notch-like epidermal growth factor-related receptor isoform X2 [Patella vulgata]|nr:delta and Notch-like epidermal growth factor-related receptor isoform X2 [Patella vulgata]
MPVEIQHKTVLKFKPSTNMQIDFPILPYKVDEQGFLNCDRKGGFPIVKNETNQTITISPDILDIGSNYFIVDLEDHKLVSCEFGLRLNVTVKEQHCWKDGDRCSGRGNCVSKRGQSEYTCNCCDMFNGKYCDTFDACLGEPCQNGAQCQHKKDSESGFTCKCRLGYHGAVCSERVENLCVLDLCMNNGSCVGNKTHFQCLCPPGFTGSHCEVNINECQPKPCIHGVCVDFIDKYQCFCLPGYYGGTCNMEYDLCNTSPCKNHGICIMEVDSYRCHCHPGHTGPNCTKNVDLCTPNPCYNKSRCSSSHNVTCHCSPGYTGTRCEINLNECESNPCLNGGTCKDRVDGYACLCHELHAGPNCEYTIDMFAPFLQGKTTDMSGNVRSYHVENLYIVAGTLSGAILIVIIVLTTCYCRMHETYKNCSLKRMKYSRQKDEPRETSVDVSSVATPRLSIDAIWEATSLNYDINQLNSPLRQSLKPKNI